MSAPHDPYLARAIHGRYRLIEQIGVGAFGAVYRAKDLKNDQDCAVKLLHISAAESAQVTDRFWDEARYVAELCHPHVVESYDYGADEDGTLFLCMELLRGRDLGSVLSDTPKLTIEATLHIVRQIGSALHTVHLANIVHRDLKPKNIFLVDGADRGPALVKVIDFGLAKHLGPWVKDRGSAGMLIGTPDYLPPEAWSGNSGAIDPRSDQWSLAVLTYRMLTGRLPFIGDGDMLRVRRAILEATPQPPRALEPSLPAYLEAALLRALSKNKEQRFRDVRDFLRALHDRSPIPPSARAEKRSLVSVRGTPELCLRDTERLSALRIPSQARAPVPSHITVMMPAPRTRLSRRLQLPIPEDPRHFFRSRYLPLLILIAALGTLGCLLIFLLASPQQEPSLERIRYTLAAAREAWVRPRVEPQGAPYSLPPSVHASGAGAGPSPVESLRTRAVPLRSATGADPAPASAPNAGALQRPQATLVGPLGASGLRKIPPNSKRKKRYDGGRALSASAQLPAPHMTKDGHEQDQPHY